jgi:hypothetical protein
MYPFRRSFHAGQLPRLRGSEIGRCALEAAVAVDPIAPIPIKRLDESTLAPPPPKEEIDPKVMKAANDFEAMVIGQMLQPMFESLDSDGMFGGGSGERMFRPMLVDQYAQTMAKAGGIGIAQAVAREMMKLQEGEQSAPPAPAAPKP